MNQWNINRKTTRRIAISAWLVAIFGVIFGCKIIFLNKKIEFNANYMSLIFLILSIVSLILFLNNKRREMGKLILTQDFIIIPRFVFAEVKLRITDITFINVFGEKTGHPYVVIGRRLKDSIVVSSALFSSRYEMHQFLAILQVVANGKLRRTCNQTNSFGKVFKEIKVTTLFSIFLIVIYFLSRHFFILNFPELLESISLTKANFFSVDWYRYFSSAFFHLDHWHFLLNLITLSLLGRAVEGIVSWQRCINIILLSIFVGSIISVNFSPYDHVVGASGGIMGLFGSYIVFYYRYSTILIDSKFPKSSTILLFLVMQVLADIFLGNSDAASHLGGFFTGIIYAKLSKYDSSLIFYRSSKKIESILSIGLLTLYFAGFLKSIFTISEL